MSEIKLKRCPFCGGEAEIEYEGVDGYYQKYYSWVHVVCKNCYATTGRTYGDKDRSKAYAIRAWNTRKPLQEIVENLEAELLVASLEVELCASDNSLEIDSAKGYANGVASAIETVKEVGGMNE